MNANNITNAENLINNINGQKIKYVKKDKGLMERKDGENEKVILMEDNREILLG